MGCTSAESSNGPGWYGLNCIPPNSYVGSLTPPSMTIFGGGASAEVIKDK